MLDCSFNRVILRKDFRNLPPTTLLVFRMLDALKSTHRVIEKCAQVLLSGPGSEAPVLEDIRYNVDDVRHSHDSLPERHTITIGYPVTDKRLVVYNSLTFARREVVTFIVSTPYVEVMLCFRLI